MLLRNDLYGGKVLPGPIVSHGFPQTLISDDLSVHFPEVFASSVVTCAMVRSAKETDVEDQHDALIDSLWLVLRSLTMVGSLRELSPCRLLRLFLNCL